MTLREKEALKMGDPLRSEFSTRPRAVARLTGEQVTQHLDANKAMLTAIAGASILAQFSRSSVWASR
jgi:hypothetical protein